ncbi:GNAT family N-acetyltransferase [Ramlibacter algicola]|uniref:GNAT family N-acetyltransferase n=1 Tax=Ramlibacter algicola TaxID=2795217 RepID=A0A934UR97_9BURK|nr:GNAT family N-acetyltransferase [Ramlibacter algicola]MBK0392302.1 GNAT family N-acetyltransferase [Ramlibacter algicola]
MPESHASTELRLRRGEPRDLDVITSFNRAMALETEGRRLQDERSLAGVRRLLAEPALGFYLVAERAGEVVGSLMVTYEWSDWRDGLFWWIQSVYVRPEARRQGVFRALYAHVSSLALADPGVCGLRLYVERENVRAQATYESLGMHRTHYHVYEAERPGASFFD